MSLLLFEFVGLLRSHVDYVSSILVLQLFNLLSTLHQLSVNVHPSPLQLAIETLKSVAFLLQVLYLIIHLVKMSLIHLFENYCLLFGLNQQRD